MVKEGHDSTVRPKVQTYGFDNGKMFVDAWAADGKPMLSKSFQAWTRVLGVVASVGVLSLVLADWGTVAQQQEHVFSPVQRAIFGWWATFIEMDEADVAKAQSVMRPRRSAGPALGSTSQSLMASAEARENFYKAAKAVEGREHES